MFSNLHLFDAVLLIKLQHAFAELGLHLIPNVDESPLNYVELLLLLGQQTTPLTLVLLQQIGQLFVVLLHEQLLLHQQFAT